MAYYLYIFLVRKYYEVAKYLNLSVKTIKMTYHFITFYHFITIINGQKKLLSDDSYQISQIKGFFPYLHRRNGKLGNDEKKLQYTQSDPWRGVSDLN